MEEETEIRINTLKELAAAFGLPCIVRKEHITIIGEVQLLLFKIKENNQCQQI